MKPDDSWALPGSWKFAIILTLILATILQIILVADLTILLLAFCVMVISWIAVWNYGLSNVGAIIVLFFGSNTVTFSFLIKTFILQPVDTYLYDPLSVFLVVLAGIVQMLIAFLIINHVKIPALFKPTLIPQQLDSIGFISFFLGSAAWLVNQLLSLKVQDFSVDDPGIGGFGIFKNFLIMSVIAYTASLLIKSEGKTLINFKLVFIFIMALGMGIIDNSKLSLFLPFFAYFVTVLYFNQQTWKKFFRIHFILMAVLVVYLFPVITYFRQMNITGQHLSDKILLVKNTLVTESFSEIMENSRYWTNVAYGYGYYDYFGGNGRFQMVAGRFASVQEIDPVVALINPQFPLGWEPISLAVQSVIPRIFFAEKDISNDAYYISRSLNLGSRLLIYPTVPMLAVAFASLGIPGLLIIPFVVFLVYFILFKLAGWNLDKNIFSIFFLCVVFPYIHEGSLQNYIGFIVRQIPTLMVLVFFIVQASKIFLKPEKEPA